MLKRFESVVGYKGRRIHGFILLAFARRSFPRSKKLLVKMMRMTAQEGSPLVKKKIIQLAPKLNEIKFAR